MNEIAPRPFRRRTGALALLLLTVGCYLPAMAGGFIWDDNHYITDNVNLLTLHGLQQIWFHIGAVPQYYPVTHTTFWIEHHLWGNAPLGYHLDNVLLHAASAVLLWGILVRLQLPGAWLIAAIFALHPIQVESVAWATERKNVLSGVFFMLAMQVYLGFCLDGDEVSSTGGPPVVLNFSVMGSKDKNHGRAARATTTYLAALLFFILALLSKSVTSSFPAVVLVLIWWKRGHVTRRHIVPLLPFLALGLAMGSLTGWMEKHVVGAVGSEWNFTIVQRCVIAGRAIFFYAMKLLIPLNFTFIYPRWNLDLHRQPALILFPISVAVIVSILWLLRKRIGRGPVAGVLLFIGMLFPALGFVNVYPMRYSFVADHFQYLAGIALVSLIIAPIARWLQSATPAPLLAFLILTPLAIQTWRQGHVYFDQRTLWHDTVIKNPGSWMAHSNYGGVLQGQGDILGAVEQFETALRLRPDDSSSLIAMGLISEQHGNHEQAARYFRRAVDARPDSDEPVLRRIRCEPLYDLGALYTDMAQAQENAKSHDAALIHQYRRTAIDYYRQSLKCYPDYDLALVNLGEMLAQEGQSQEATATFWRALQANPNSISAHNDLGNLLLAQGKTDEALGQWRQSLQIQPDDATAHFNIGLVYMKQQRWNEAVIEFQEVIRVDPAFRGAAGNLAVSLMNAIPRR